MTSLMDELTCELKEYAGGRSRRAIQGGRLEYQELDLERRL